MTFPDPGLTLAAVERLAEEWGAFERGEGLRCPMNVAVHKGVLYAFRSYLYSRDLAVAVAVESATSQALGSTGVLAVVAAAVSDLG